MAGASAIDYATRATDEALREPDWVLTFELCDIVNKYPRQAKDVMKLLKKRLGSKNPSTQLIVLDVLETLSKNCGENVLLQIIECNILHEMVKIVKKKLYSDIKKKVVILIGTWKDSFGGQGQYPEFSAAFKEIQSAGVENSLPAQEGDTLVSLQTQDTAYPEAMTSKNAIRASVLSDVSHLRDINKARGIAHMLMEMLNALNPRDSEGAKQEVIVDLVDKCHSYKNHFTSLSRNMRLEELLNECITLNDELQHVLKWHGDIVKGKPTREVQMTTVAPLLVLNNEDCESDDDSFQLIRRSSKHPVEPSKGHSVSRSSKKSGAVDNSVTVDNSESPQRKSSLRPPTSQSTILPPSSENSRKQLFTNKQQPSIGENSGTSYNNPMRNSHDHTSLQNVPIYSYKLPVNHSDGPNASVVSWDARLAKDPEQRSKIYTAKHGERSWIAEDLSVSQGKTTSSLQQLLPASGGQVLQDTSSINSNPMTECHQKQQLNEQQNSRLGTSISARCTDPIGKNNNQSALRERKPSSPTEWPQSHSDGEDLSPLSEDVRSGTSNKSRLKSFLDFGKKSKKSSESNSGSRRTRR